MKNTNKIKLSFSILASLVIISCSMPVDNTNLYTKNSVIKGKVEFPESMDVSKKNYIGFKTKATINQVGSKATISLIYPSDDTENPNVTISTGLSDTNGNFTINPDFNPVTNKVYILEASKRIGSSGNDLISVRTYIKWAGNSWQSITAPNLSINPDTTAITIIDSYDNSITSNDAINKINNGIIYSIGNISISIINNVSNMANFLISHSADPTRFISYQNNDFIIMKEYSYNKEYLSINKFCPNCNLSGEDMSNIDLSSSNLINSNLMGANLSGANLSGANLSGANLTNVKLVGANLSGANLSNVTWVNGNTICDAESLGTCIFPDIRVNTYTTGIQQSSSIAMDAKGNFVIVWISKQQDGSGYGVYGQRYNSLGNSQGSEFRINSYTINDQRNASVTMDAIGNFVVTWQSINQASNLASYGGLNSLDDIYAQRYNSLGIPQGAEFKVNTHITGWQSNPSVAINNKGDFIISWTSEEMFDQDIFAKRFNSDGIEQGSEFIVNSYTTYTQHNSSVDIDDIGNFVITWKSNQDGGSGPNGGYGIYAQGYNNLGIPQGSEFKVNTYTTNNQENPKIAMDSTGNFVITWESSVAQDGSQSGIYAQKYNSSRISQGSEFRVNTYTTGSQSGPSIAMDINGNYIITWTSGSYYTFAEDGDRLGVYGQRYNSNGLTQGTEFKINTYTTGSQSGPLVAMDNVGNFVVTWKSDSMVYGPNIQLDKVNRGIYMHRYDSNGNPK